MASEAIGEIIEDARRGDPDALRALFNRFSGPVFRFVVHFTGDRAAAKDLTQDIFVTAFGRLDELTGSKTFRGLVFRLAATACRRHGQRGENGPPDFEVVRFDEHEISEPLLRQLKEEAIAETIQEIDEAEQQEAVRLFYGESELNAAGICERLKLSSSTVADVLARVRSRIRRRAMERLREHADAVIAG